MTLEDNYRKIAPKLTNWLVATGSGYHEACDLVQETFVKLWKMRDDLRDNDAAVSGLVFTIARNLRKNMAREENRISAMRDRLEAGILAACPNVRVNGDRAHRLPNTLNVSFEYIEGEAIAYRLSDIGICISTGSACASGSLDPSHVIRAMGVPFIAVHGSVRFSLSRYNTMDEIDYVLENLPPVIRKLRELSPFGPDADPTTFS